jgi:hypothetical protein
MVRIFRAVVALYVLTALVGKILEAAGLSRCGCSDDCWCRRPGLSVLRWAFPFGHT